MSQVSLFRKWRSAAFSELVGQEAVVKTLRNVLQGGSPARAYLFCGPRGTGKTSTARIFAKSLCCEEGPTVEPCNRCSICREINAGSCLDVFEIDAASNTQVEKIRDFIVDKVHFAPARARYKVYIIDEVHKLSSSSFNALLKTLEEPPSHVVFVLATTHPHEILPTILSRCQRYDFRAFSLSEVEQHLRHVAAQESIEFEGQACNLLARSAQGSMRDALVLLEQAYHYCGSTITAEDVQHMLGLLPYEVLGNWVSHLVASNAAALLGSIEEMHRSGQDFVRAVDMWVEHLRLLMLSKVGAEQAGLSDLGESYRLALAQQAEQSALGQILGWLRSAVEVQQTIREGRPARIALELALVELCQRPAASGPTAPPPLPPPVAEVRAPVPPKPAAQPRPVEKSPEPQRESPPPQPPRPAKEQPPPPVEPVTRREAPEAPASSLRPLTNAKEFWPRLLQQVRQRDIRLQAVLGDARICEFTPELIRVSLPASHQWHLEVIQKSIRLLEEVSGQLVQSKVRFEACLDGGQAAPPQELEHETLVKKASGLFGGRILDAANDTNAN